MNNVFLIYGEDSYRKKEYLSFLKKTKEIDSSETEVFEASKVKDFSMPLFFHSLASQNLFTIFKRLVLLKDAYFLSTSPTKGNEKDLDYFQKEMELYLKEPNEQVLLVFYMEEENLDSRKKVVKFLKAAGVDFKEFQALKPWEFPNYIRERLAQEKLVLSSGALDLLVERVQSDSMNLQKAIDALKLVPQKEYLVEDIEERIPYSLDLDVFALGNVFLDGDMKKTWKILKRFQQAQLDTQAQMALLASRLRKLYQIKELKEANYSKEEIATRLRIKPYAVQKGLESTFYWNSQRLLRLLKELADIDQGIKSGKLEAKLAFEQFILRNGQENARNS